MNDFTDFEIPRGFPSGVEALPSDLEVTRNTFDRLPPDLEVTKSSSDRLPADVEV